MEIVKLNPESPAVQAVIQDIDDLMNSLYPPESNQLLSIDALMSDDVYFIGIKNNDEIMACGAIVHKKDARESGKEGEYGELKRIYVQPEHRGKGLSKPIMQALLDHAESQHWPLVRLETGVKQPEAIALYEKLGFVIRGPFGNYPDDPVSIFMEKSLKD
ncbi:GNAT family N-acetyltransferase [Oceanospirillum beijerinckii]|uniref:GNAT family N-acetyltransferase n=1 Tax=Oceanospirillum beijerinckii TaxID=64976 RepID=UPI000423594D|nr:GNAT family N-acetyltransferase [Oceanospirillum beijerinckii]